MLCHRDLVSRLATIGSLVLFSLSLLSVPTQPALADEPVTCEPTCEAGYECIDGICILGGPAYTVCAHKPHRVCDCWYNGTVPNIGGFCGRLHFSDADSSYGCNAANCRCWWTNGPQSPTTCTHP